MKKILILTAAGLTGLLLTSGTAGATASRTGSNCDGPHDVQTYRVQIAPLTRTIQPGEVARVSATVYRSIDGRDLAPAEDAAVFVALWKGEYVRAAGAVTDDAGRAIVEIPVGRRFPSGWASATAFATREPAELPCRPLRESGGTQVERFLRIL